MLTTKKIRIFLVKCFLYLLCVFSMTVYASSDYSSLSQQLHSEKTHLQAFNKLKISVMQDPSALLPLFRFICSDYATHNGGVDYKSIKAVTTFLQEYGKQNKISDSTLESLFAIRKEFFNKGRKRHHNLIYVLQEISSSQRFSDKVVNEVLKLTSFQIKEDKKKGHNYTYPYFQTLNYQTKFQHLPKKARYLAVQYITDQAINDRVFYPPVDMLFGQLKYNDKKSEKSLLSMIKPGNNPQLRRSIIDRFAPWYGEQGKLNAFTKKILALREQEKNQEMLQYFRKLLFRLNRDKQIATDVSERILKLADTKKEKYGAKVAYMKSYVRKSKTTALNEKELENVLRALAGSNTVVALHASKAIITLNANGNVTKKLHESLIKLYFSPKNSPYQHNTFKEVIMENIPYRNIEEKYQHGKYPDALLIGITEYARKKTAKVSDAFVLYFLQEVYQYQKLPEQVVEGLYDIYIRQNQLKLQNSFAELFIRYYKETGYIRIDLLANGLYRGSFEYQKKLRNVILEELEDEYGLKEGLYKMFSDQMLNQHTRKFFLTELIKEDFDYAAKNILPPHEEEENFQEVIWDGFYRKSYNSLKRVDKEILLTATRSENFKIRHLAWKMLEGHGVSTPFMVKWEKELFRMQVYSAILFFAGGPLSFIIGSLLLLRIRKGQKVKHNWMDAVRYIVWILITMAGSIAGAGMIFLAGLSHSSTLSMQSHIVLNKGFGSIFAAYVVIALVTRLFITTVPVK